MPTELAGPALMMGLSVSYAGRGSLFRFMHLHHGVIIRDIAVFGTLWQERTNAMAEAGLKDDRGNVPSIKAVRLTWKRVCADIKKLNAQPAPPPPPPDTPILPIISPRPPSTRSQVPDDEYPSVKRIGPARSRTYPKEPT